MTEKLGKDNQPKKLKSLSELGAYLPSSSKESPRPHSLSAAASQEESEVRESDEVQWKKLKEEHPDGEAAIFGKYPVWFSPDKQRAWVEEVPGRPPRKLESFERYEIIDPKTDQPHVMFWNADGGEFYDGEPPLISGDVVEKATTEEIEEWKELKKNKADDKFSGRRVWFAPDGRAYVDFGKKHVNEKGESVPKEFVHGGSHNFWDLETKKQIGVRYWDANKKKFTKEDPRVQPQPGGDSDLARVTPQAEVARPRAETTPSLDIVPPPEVPPATSDPGPKSEPEPSPDPEPPPRKGLRKQLHVGPTGPRIPLRDTVPPQEPPQEPPGVPPREPPPPKRWRGMIRAEAPLHLRANALSTFHPDYLKDQPPTLDVIIGDRRQRELFGELLHAHGRQDLVGKYMDESDDISPPDWERIDEFRHEFAERLKLAEEARSYMTKEDMLHLFNMDPAFAPLKNSVRPEHALEIIKEHTYRLFMREEEGVLARYVEAQRELRRIRNAPSFKAMQARVQEITSVYRISPERLASPEFAIDNHNLLKRMFNPGFLASFRRSAYSKQAREALRQIDAHMGFVSHILGSSVSREKGLLREARRAAVEGRRAIFEIGASEPGNFSAAHRERDAMREKLSDVEGLRARIRDPRFRETVEEETGLDWDAMDPDAREEASYSRLEHEGLIPRRREGRGWFATWLSALFDSFMSEVRQKLQAEFA